VRSLRSFPTRRSSDLGDVEVIAAGDVDDCAFESRHLDASDDGPMGAGNAVAADIDGLEPTVVARSDDFDLVSDGIGDREAVHEDRKSTRLNSSHVSIS